MKLNELSPGAGSRKKRKRVGRGPGSGHGKTATKGHKGQLARSGGGKRAGFEGGQMPLVRRLPKRGFRSPFKETFEVVNISRFNRFEAGEVITPDVMKTCGLVRDSSRKIKVLGEGDLRKSLTIQAGAFSKQALQKIANAGGKGEVIT
jgi:large subunit ribosomal protein L15